jgi:hypothetical protein
MSIVSRLINRPESFSIEMLRRGVQSGTIPAYIGIPLIQEKLKDKQEMDNAQSARMAAQTPPPVANQVMAQAAQATQPQLQPQPQVTPPGLMGLRSNLPAKFAGGGIVSFADGGDVERYNGMFPEGSLIGKVQRGSFQFPEGSLLGLIQAAAAGDPEAQRVIEEERKKRATPTAGSMPAAGYTRPGMANDPRLIGATSPAESVGYEAERARNMALVNAPSTGAPTGQGLGGESALGRTPGMGLQLPAVPFSQSQSDVVQRQLYGTETEPGFFARAASRQSALDQKIKEAEGKVTGKAFEGLESDLRKEAQEMGASKEQAKYMAMFKAGLAMMAGTSRHALENIGKGALVGAEDYQKAAADIKKAQRENQRMMANIEQARRAEALGDRDRAIARLDRASDAEERRDALGINAIITATGQDRSNATELWKTQYSTAADIYRTERGGQYQLAAANARANRAAGITPYQLAMLRDRAAKNVDVDAVRSEVAQALKLSKTPKPGQDAAFDKRVQDLYARRIDDYAARLLGGSTGANAPSFAGFKLLGPEE